MNSLPTLDEIVEGLPDALIICDSDLRMVYVNHRTEVMLGYGAGALLGRPIDDIVPLRDLEQHRQATTGYLAHLDDTGSERTVPAGLPCLVMRGDGTEVALLATASKVISNGSTFYLASLHPVSPAAVTGAIEATRATRATRAAAEENGQLRRALRRSPIVIGTVDRDLKYTWVYNPDPHFPLDRALGKRDNEITSGRGIEELVAFKRRILELGQPDETTIEFNLPGETRTYDIFGTPLQDDTGETVAVTTVAIDVSHLRKLLRFQRDFVGMIAHDLRQPLAIMHGRAQLMAKRGTYDQDALDDIVRQGKRLGRMVDDLLDTSAVESGTLHLDPVDCELTEIVRRVAEHATQQSETHHIRVDLDTTEVRGTWDPARIEQVLENLVVNAVKYSPRGGEITIAVTTSAEDVRIAVSDPGIGMDPDDLPAIFECFGRTPAARRKGIAGLGLGLCIAKGLVEAHGGRISASSDGPDCGSTLVFTLPFAAPPVPARLSA